SGDAGATVTVTRPGGTLTDTTAVVDVYKGLDSTKAGPQTTGATTTRAASSRFNTPAITPSGATTREHMITMVAAGSTVATWAASPTVNATGTTWAVQASGTTA